MDETGEQQGIVEVAAYKAGKHQGEAIIWNLYVKGGTDSPVGSWRRLRRRHDNQDATRRHWNGRCGRVPIGSSTGTTASASTRRSLGEIVHL